MKREIDVVDDGTYRAPSQLRKRSEFSFKGGESDNRVFEANEYVPFYLFITTTWLTEVFPFTDNAMCVHSAVLETIRKYNQLI